MPVENTELCVCFKKTNITSAHPPGLSLRDFPAHPRGLGAEHRAVGALSTPAHGGAGGALAISPSITCVVCVSRVTIICTARSAGRGDVYVLLSRMGQTTVHTHSTWAAPTAQGLGDGLKSRTAA